VDKVPKQKIVSVNFSNTVISLLGFLTFEDGTDRLPRNVGKELSLCAVYLRIVQISHDNLVMQVFVWLRTILRASYANFKMTSHI